MSGTPVVWDIVDLAMRGIMIKPTLIIWGISCCLARRRSDPARVAFSYLKAIFPFFVVWLVLWVAADALAIVQYELEENDGEFPDPTTYSSDYLVGDILERFIYVALLFQYITDVLTVICLVELGNGFLYCLRQGRTAVQKALRWSTIGVGVVVMILAIAWFGIWNAAYTSYYNSITSVSYEWNYNTGTYNTVNNDTGYNYNATNAQFAVGSDLETACDVILMVVALATVGYASYVVHCCRAAPVLRNSAVLFLIATILNLMRECWNVAFDGLWNIPQAVVPYADNSIVDPILNEWSLFVLLVLVFVIGLRKMGGLWSTNQPWMQSGNAFAGAAAVPKAMEQPGWQTWQQPAPAWQQNQPQAQQQQFAGYPPEYGAPVTSEMQGWHQQPVQQPPQQQQVSPLEWQQGQVEMGGTPAPGYSPPPAAAGELESPGNGHVHELK